MQKGNKNILSLAFGIRKNKNIKEKLLKVTYLKNSLINSSKTLVLIHLKSIKITE